MNNKHILQGDRRKFLNDLAISVNVKNPSDWGKVSPEIIRNSGGRSLLRKHNESIQNLLENTFPGNHIATINCRG